MSMAATKRTNRTTFILISILEDKNMQMKLGEVELKYTSFKSKPKAREDTT